MTRRSESPRPGTADRRLQTESPLREPAVPFISGSRTAYYLFPRGGHRMAVALLNRGERLRVNDAIDVVVLEIYNGSVKLGVIEHPRVS